VDQTGATLPRAKLTIIMNRPPSREDITINGSLLATGVEVERVPVADRVQERA
jgi:hypothetical protein